MKRLYTGNFSNQSLTVKANTIREAYYLLIAKAIKTKNNIDCWSLKEIWLDGKLAATAKDYISNNQVDIVNAQSPIVNTDSGKVNNPNYNGCYIVTVDSVKFPATYNLAYDIWTDIYGKTFKSVDSWLS